MVLKNGSFIRHKRRFVLSLSKHEGVFMLSPNWRFWCLFVSIVLLALNLTYPTLKLNKPVFRYLFIIDITQSMNASDYHQEGLPNDRLGFAKASIRQAIDKLPCGSEVGLGLFTTRNIQVLFEPLEICEHHPIIADVLDHIDWRMAWSADSYIARGLFTGLREAAAGVDTRLLFLTDGQQFPPEPDFPTFDGKPGVVSGLIVGVGGSQPVPIPRLDKENQPIGFWEYMDLGDYLPTSAMPTDGSSLYLTRLDEQALIHLANITGLSYHRLETPDGFAKALLAKGLAVKRTVAVDIRSIFGFLALLLLLFTRIK